jgi:Mu-like prophage I protein
MPEYLTIPDVEIATVGMRWPTVNGEMTIRFEHLRDAMVAANDDPHVVEPRIKIGHEDPRFNADEEHSHDPFESGDGDPAFGVVRNLRLVNDDAVLLGDYTEVPAWLAEAMPSAYPSRSIEGGYMPKDGVRPAKPEGAWKVETPGGKHYSLVLTAVALLGVYGPAVLDIEDLRRYLVEGQGIIVSGTPPKGGVVASATIGAMEARADADKVIEQFCYEFATGDYAWWWPRALWTDPNEVIADDDEGSLYRVPFSSNDKQEVTFDEPVRVIERFEDAPATAIAGSLGRGKQERLYARREDSPTFVTDNAWDGSASRFTDEQYVRSCVLDRKYCGEGDLPPKQRCSLPIREPGGELNRNGVHAAAARVNQVSACDEAKAKAKAKLRSAYGELGEEPPDSITAQKGGVGSSGKSRSMDHAAELRKVLGLSAEASEDEVKTALAAREGDEETTPPAENGGEGETGDEGAETGGEGTETETETESDEETETPPEGEGVEAKGTVQIDRETLRDLREKAEQGATARVEQIKAHRERVLDAGIKAGKFAPARAEHYRALFESDPEGTEQLIDGLAEGLVPVDERGSSSDPGSLNATAVTEDEMLRLFPGAYRPQGASS